MGKVFQTAAEALDGLCHDGMTVMSGGFGKRIEQLTTRERSA